MRSRKADGAVPIAPRDFAARRRLAGRRCALLCATLLTYRPTSAAGIIAMARAMPRRRAYAPSARPRSIFPRLDLLHARLGVAHLGIGLSFLQVLPGFRGQLFILVSNPIDVVIFQFFEVQQHVVGALHRAD